VTTTENKPGPFPVNVSGLSFEVEESSPLRNDARSGADTLLLSQPDTTGGASSVARAGRLDSASDVDWYRVSAQGPFGIYERIWVSLDTATDSRWFDRHEVVVQTPNGYVLQQARSGGDLILELRASDTVVDAATHRAEFYLQVLSVADTDHAHRTDPYRLLIERRSTPGETIPVEPMSMVSPVTLVGTTARIAAYRADLVYAMAVESADELLVAGLSGDALGGTLVRLKGVTSLELLDQTVSLLSTGTGLGDSPPLTGPGDSSLTAGASPSDSSLTTNAGPSDSSTSTTPAQILSPLAWRNYGPNGLGDGFDQGHGPITRIITDPGLGSLDLSSADLTASPVSHSSGNAPIGSSVNAPISGPANAATVAPANAGTVAPANAATVAPANAGTVTPANAATVAPANAGTVTPANAATVTPADARLGSASGLAAFRADSNFAGVAGEHSTVVVIDSGIDLDHPAFAGGRILYSYDFSGRNDSDASDFTGHGTHVAGIIASGDGMFPGVAPDARLIVLKALGNDGGGNAYDLREAIEWTLANRDRYDINVVNLSLGFGEFHTDASTGFLSSPLRALAQSGVIIVAAAGNQYVSKLQAERQGVNYPAADPAVIGVGASWSDPAELDQVLPASTDAFRDQSAGVTQPGKSDAIALFSQRDGGEQALSDVFAPGVHILSADAQGGFTQVLSGTSMAAAQISGIAALAQSLAHERLGRRLMPGEFLRLLEQTADRIEDSETSTGDGSAVDNTELSFPRVNVHALARAIDSMSTSDTASAPDAPAANANANANANTNTTTTATATAATNQPPVNGASTATAADFALLRADDWIIGTPLAERLSGGEGHDRLQGAGGDDSLIGGDGDDWLQPGLTGSNWLDGGVGRDQVLYAGPRAHYQIATEGRITLVRTAHGTEHLLLDVETLQFSDQTLSLTALQSGTGQSWPDVNNSLRSRLPELAILAEGQPARPGAVALAAFQPESFAVLADAIARDEQQVLLDPARLFESASGVLAEQSALELKTRGGMRRLNEGRFVVRFDPEQASFNGGDISVSPGWAVQAAVGRNAQGDPLGEVIVSIRRDQTSAPLPHDEAAESLFSIRLTPQWSALTTGSIQSVSVMVESFVDTAGFNYLHAPLAANPSNSESPTTPPQPATSALLHLPPQDLPSAGREGITGKINLVGRARQQDALLINEDLLDAATQEPLGNRGLRVQWFELRAGLPVAIPGASDSSFTPTQAQVGLSVGARLEFGQGDATRTVYSPWTEPVANFNDSPTGELRLSGLARLGERLTTFNTVTDTDGIPLTGPGSPRIQWFADGEAISGAIGNSLLLTRSQLGRRIHARLDYVDHFGAREQVDSDPSLRVAAIDGMDPELSLVVRSLSGVAGDGNGDGIPDLRQSNVISAPVRLVGGDSAQTYVTLVADSRSGKTAGDSALQVTGFSQTLEKLDSTPAAMKTPLGQISFTAQLDATGKTEQFSLYVEDARVNGYWKKDASGTWVNLASPAFGGLTSIEGGKTRLDFKIRDGHWPFDADGAVNGVIQDPGLPALMAQSVTLYLPSSVSSGLWF
jgi:hypothetical protein